MDICAYPAKRISVGEYACSNNLKKILVMGERGTGKSTVLNAFVNYLSGVEMRDRFRFRLEEESEFAIPTNAIRGYYLERTRLSFDIVIWDTPGLIDCERDSEVTQQINNLLMSEDACHAICIVVKDITSSIRKYIIEKMLLFFGREVAQNIYVLVTHAEGTSPKVLSKLQGEVEGFPLNGGKCFAFNNADLFTGASRAPWHATMSCIEQLFTILVTETHISFSTSKYVIEEREELRIKMDSITNALDYIRGINKVIDTNKEVLENCRQITKDFCEMVIPSEEINTFCTVCQYTCHESCAIGNNEKSSCCVMADGYCTVCPGKCMWNWHISKKQEGMFPNISQLEENQNSLEENQNSLEKNRNDIKGAIKNFLDDVSTHMRNLSECALLCQSTCLLQCFEEIVEREKKNRNKQFALQYENYAKQEQIKMRISDLNDETIMAYAESAVEEYFKEFNPEH